MTTSIIILVTVLSANWYNAKNQKAQVDQQVKIELEKREAANKVEGK